MIKNGIVADCAYTNCNDIPKPGSVVKLSFNSTQMSINNKYGVYMCLETPKIDAEFDAEFDWNKIPIISNWYDDTTRTNIIFKIESSIKILNGSFLSMSICYANSQ